MTTDPTLRPVEPADRAFVERLLDSSDSPHAALDVVFESLYVFEAGGERLGVVGLADRGRAGLVRTAIVDAPARGSGWGTEMCDRLLGEARERDVSELYLLTTTAAGFFERLGFVETDRDSVPEAVKGTPEFADLCPSEAVCMSCELSGGEHAGGERTDREHAGGERTDREHAGGERTDREAE